MNVPAIHTSHGGMVTTFCGDCRTVLPTLPDAQYDAAFTDPPYPEIDRPYGRVTEADWLDMMDDVIPQIRRVLKPTGSAIIVLQANSEFVGRTRTWLWKFLAKWGDEWGQVQDLYWWNTKAQPSVHCNRRYGLTRPSVKHLVWLGPPDCWRDQDVLLRPVATSTLSDGRRYDGRLKYQPSGGHVRHKRSIGTPVSRGGSTPFNVFSFGNPGSRTHPGSTPLQLTDRFVRFICPVGGTVIDPFAGHGTTGRAAAASGRHAVLIEKESAYCRAIAGGDGP